ncbi:SPbeta prophage-derived endonuclease YokF [Paenibacillus allorhizoplanae]|uniref:SPbeta prophage-derived endonuclease YokF n=1 Tax=Paenibacillus allorhizoplanae TaxID=2905648 RepID=A0ABM9C8J9_9BACL|nr:thermonuclease family protein [Paenibacillus allorhizoplanae]CAH1206003.1 SPbeta prophage-derived endonuclease YokF [Paenibacillus allorhizoplanae]
MVNAILSFYVKKQIVRAGIFLLLIMVVSACSSSQVDVGIATPSAAASASNKATVKGTDKSTINKRIPAKVVRVVDGDTMKISFTDGGKDKEETIRLLLVDTPESVDPEKPVQPFALEASNYAKTMLTGQDVQLELDVSERDKYGRLLCYLYIGDKMFNELLLENGYARVAYIYPPNVKYVDQFREIQKKAQQKALNIWSVENYAQEDGYHEGVVKGGAAASPKSTTTPKPVTTLQPKANTTYNSCKEANAAGAYKIKKGEPGYSAKLDGDGDGVACE